MTMDWMLTGWSGRANAANTYSVEKVKVWQRVVVVFC